MRVEALPRPAGGAGGLRRPGLGALVPSGPHLLSTTWVTVLALAMAVVSDYRLRRRPPGEALSGSADVSVVIELGIYGAVAAFLVLSLARPPRLTRTSPLLIAGWCFAFTLALTCFYAVYPVLALARAAQLLITAGLAHAITLHADRRHLHHLVHAYLVLVGLSVVLGAVRPFPRTELTQNRFNWLYVHPVMAATYLGLAVVLLLALLLRDRARWPIPGWPNWVYLCLLAVDFGALLATRTRGGLAGCIIGCFVVTIVSVRHKSRLDVAVLSVAVAALTAIVAASEILSFLARDESSSSLRTLSARTVLWEEAFRLFGDRPLFGYGLTASRGLFFEAVGLGGAHNAFINAMVDGGTFGLVAFLALLFVLIRSARQVRWAGRNGSDVPLVLGALAFLLGNSFTVEFLATPANIANVWLFVLVGWVGVLHRTASAPP